MRKTFRYRDLSAAVADDEDVNFTVEFLSDGNTGNTSVYVSDLNIKEIENAGTVFLGKGKDLRSEQVVTFSDIANLAPQADKITVKFLVNSKEIITHTNPKTDPDGIYELDRPNISLTINFIKP